MGEKRKEMGTVAISVIIPIYNVGKYIETCLASLQKQTFTNYEVWMIDDGSRDESGQLCDNFQQQDARFHTIHKANGGASSARNTGLEVAQGKWICFVDADDTVDETYLQHLWEATNGIGTDTLVVQGFKIHTTASQPTLREFPEHTFESEEIYRTFLELNIHRSGFPFAKLYSKDIIIQHKLKFDENIHYAEDVMFMLSYLCHVTTIRTVSGAYYNYFIRDNNSLSQRIFPFESEYTCYQTYLSLMQQLQHRFHLQEKVMEKPNSVISEYLVRRSIGSLYQPQTRKPCKERIKILKSVTPEQLDFLNRYYKQCSWFHKITVLLLNKHYYYLCDWFNISISCRFALKKLMTKYL